METEAHVIRECDQLIEIIERKKEKFLNHISKEYNKLIDDIQTTTNKLSNNLDSMRAIDEIMTYSVRSDNIIGVLEVNLLESCVILQDKQKSHYSFMSSLSSLHRPILLYYCCTFVVRLLYCCTIVVQVLYFCYTFAVF